MVKLEIARNINEHRHQACMKLIALEEDSQFSFGSGAESSDEA
jgi:hypothetical protein